MVPEREFERVVKRPLWVELCAHTLDSGSGERIPTFSPDRQIHSPDGMGCFDAHCTHLSS
jgi:hypothetical protein